LQNIEAGTDKFRIKTLLSMKNQMAFWMPIFFLSSFSFSTALFIFIFCLFFWEQGSVSARVSHHKNYSNANNFSVSYQTKINTPPTHPHPLHKQNTKSKWVFSPIF